MAMEDGTIVISNEHLTKLMKLIALRWRLVLSAGILFALIAVAALSFKSEKHAYFAVLRPSEIHLAESEKRILFDSKILITEKLRGSGFANKLSKIYGDNIIVVIKDIDRQENLISLTLYATKKLEENKLFQEVIQILNQDNLLFIENYRRLLGLDLKDTYKRIEKRNLMLAKLDDCQNLDPIQTVHCIAISDAHLRAIALDSQLKSRIIWALDNKNTFETLVLEDTITYNVQKNRYELIAISFFILGCLVCIFVLSINLFKNYLLNLNNR
jgi:hypothetical protein